MTLSSAVLVEMLEYVYFRLPAPWGNVWCTRVADAYLVSLLSMLILGFQVIFSMAVLGLALSAHSRIETSIPLGVISLLIWNFEIQTNADVLTVLSVV